MTFTDDDLKRLKEREPGPEDEIISFDELDGLIFRLEAAEEVIHSYLDDDCLPYFNETINRWRRVKGELI